MREGGSFGGCLFQILIILVVLALIGFVEWSTVGNWVWFMVILAIAGFLFVLIGYFLGKKGNKKQE